MLNRRNLLSLFTTGSLVAPLVKGQPLLDATAKLIEPATVVPARLTVHPASPADLAKLAGGSGWIELIVHTPDGDHLAMAAEAVNFTVEADWDELRSIHGGPPHQVKLRSNLQFKVSGRLLDPISFVAGVRR